MQELAESGKSQAETLSKNIVSLESEARRQAELAAQRETELTARLAQREAELLELKSGLETSRGESLELHREIENSGRSYNATVEALKAEKSMNEGALAQVRQDRDRLQREVETLKQQAESNWANERVEGALLRERINDVAAEVVRLAANLEGKNSPIQKILDQVPPARQNGGPRTPRRRERGSGPALARRQNPRAPAHADISGKIPAALTAPPAKSQNRWCPSRRRSTGRSPDPCRAGSARFCAPQRNRDGRYGRRISGRRRSG